MCPSDNISVCSFPVIDVNVASGQWPFLRTRPTSPAGLARHQTAHGICASLVTANETLFRPDWDTLNRQLAKATVGLSNLFAVPTVDPRQPLACELLRELAPVAVRLAPAFHGYPLESVVDTPLGDSLKLPTSTLPLLIPIHIEDHRGRHPTLHQTHTPIAPVIALAHALPHTTIICLGAQPPAATQLTQAAPNILVDIAFCDKPDPIATLIQTIPYDKILFGSNTPLFATLSSLLKLTQKHLPQDAVEAICWKNACRIMPKLKRRLNEPAPEAS